MTLSTKEYKKRKKKRPLVRASVEHGDAFDSCPMWSFQDEQGMDPDCGHPDNLKGICIVRECPLLTADLLITLKHKG